MKKYLALVSVSLLALAACSQNSASVTTPEEETMEASSEAMMEESSSSVEAMEGAEASVTMELETEVAE